MHSIFPKPKRIMLKLSGEAMKGDFDFGLNPDFITKLAKKIKQLAAQDIQVVVVIGGGNIYRGAQATKGSEYEISRILGDHIGMLATVMNSLALSDILTQVGQDNVALTALEMPRVLEFFSTHRANEALNSGKVVISAGGTGNPFFTTDTCAVQRALELECDILVKGTQVDGIYNKDPLKHDDAYKFTQMTPEKALDLGVKIMDQAAIALALDNDLPLFVCKIDDIDNIAGDEIVGTYVEKGLENVKA